MTNNDKFHSNSNQRQTWKKMIQASIMMNVALWKKIRRSDSLLNRSDSRDSD